MGRPVGLHAGDAWQWPDRDDLAAERVQGLGEYHDHGTPIDRSGAVNALVSGNTLQLLYPTGVTGWLTVQGDTISGQLDGMNPATVTLKKVK